MYRRTLGNEMDIFYENLKQSIIKFYNEFFCNERSTLQIHLDLLRSCYNEDRFKNCENLEKERIAFLTELQTIIEEKGFWGS